MRFALVCCALVVVLLLHFNNEVEAMNEQSTSTSMMSIEFANFVKKFNKIYESPAEQKLRYQIFSENYVKATGLQSANVKATSGSARYGVTKFSDLTQEEFAQMYLGRTGASASSSFIAQHYAPPSNINANLPSTFDWRNKNAVTPVKNQGQCGSCWAFSATEAIESAWFLANNSLPGLSEQQIVDCDTVDAGCNGGDTPTAYQYVIQAGGLETETDYPYTAEDGSCAFKKADVVASIKSWKYVTQDKNEVEMQQGLYADGPLSVCVDAETWQYYIGGVIAWGDLCENSLDHCVMITGWNDNQGGYKVWNVRNSWGEDWGESGYLWVERGYDLCGIADEVTLPLVK